eukprot:CAMPEP_0170552370 /NCGR_PEP_ID=MMETSP0211-20121228/10272_1 /TAXON_ID=311385 /ORGANISM="Pseudokeronopsis sp., Strain OXSARD2" /LENGTH=39 /DNA_ID= /DNA_START= /DNA_END= /DNA_ORIENTATION=
MAIVNNKERKEADEEEKGEGVRELMEDFKMSVVSTTKAM